MDFHDGVADGKAHTETGPLRCKKRLEDVLQVHLINARAEVSYRHPDPIVFDPVRKIICLCSGGL